MAKLAVIIPAAGSGTRMGSRIPKPFLTLQNITILEHSIRSFAHLESVAQIVIATSKEWENEVEAILNKFSHHLTSVLVVEGGEERQDSINNALSVLLDDIELVAIHDAVRPFINEELIIACTKEASLHGGAIIAIPAKDTIKVVDKNLSIQSTPDRSNLWQAQTPQIFKKALIEEAYASAKEEKFKGTDDASLVERIGGTVKIIEGDRRNLKITYPIDLQVAEMILNEKGVK